MRPTPPGSPARRPGADKTGQVLRLVPPGHRPVPLVVVYGTLKHTVEGALQQCVRTSSGYLLTVDLDEGPFCVWVSDAELPRPPKPNARVRVLPYHPEPAKEIPHGR